MDVLGWVGAIGGCVGSAAGVAAVVVSVIFNRMSSNASVRSADSSERSEGHAQRSADAAQRSATSAEQSADAAQRTAGVAERNEQRQIEEGNRRLVQEEDAGPTFEQNGKSSFGESTEVRLRTMGGPPSWTSSRYLPLRGER